MDDLWKGGYLIPWSQRQTDNYLYPHYYHGYLIGPLTVLGPLPPRRSLTSVVYFITVGIFTGVNGLVLD